MGDEAIDWYRVPIDKDTLKSLTRRSDARGWVQALGHLALVAATGYGVFFVFHHFAWPWVLLAFFVHGTVIQFLGGVGAFHELCHGTPFKTRWLNEAFLWIVSFTTWSNFVYFRTSHIRHHQYTVFKGWDLEVVLPVNVLASDRPDWRRSYRTVLQGPITSFLYWQMNYHTEHHMYAAVPFHALPKLHRVIAHDSPPPNRGLISAWKEILYCKRRQAEDPAWVFDPFQRTG